MVFSIVLIVALGLILLRLGVELGLSLLNSREVRRHEGRPPASVGAIMDDATYRKATAYTLARGSFGRVELVWDAFILMAVLASGVLVQLYHAICPPGSEDVVLRQVFFLISAGLGLSLFSLPLEWWSQFRLEQRFEFNKSTPKLWVMDKIKGLVLTLLIGVPLLWLLLSLVEWVGPLWWLLGFAVIFGFQLLMLVLYPKFIMPLFNKLSPLPEGDLRTRLLALSDRTGFHASTIQVMDGSKRSGHSNAFFTGFGRFRRIVLYDTLIEQLTPVELEAVLAHEVGHYKRGHIPKMLAVSACMMLGGFALVAWLASSAWFNPAFGFPAGRMGPAFLLFALLGGLLTFWFTPLGNLFSRKHEYEADTFARVAMKSPEPLVGALRKLAQKNLTNLTPHPLFSRFYYSHPTLVEREAALMAAKETEIS